MLKKIKKIFSQEKPVIEDIENRVEEILFELIGEMNELRPEDQKIAKERSTQLFGEDGALDSLEVVNLIVALEQKIQSDLGFAITLADEKAMSMKNSPFRTLASLSDYIVLLIQETAR
jgi:D-alanine--poly(phosphoribitol) ligase subunit 2